MGDVADILGLNPKENTASTSSDNLFNSNFSKIKKTPSSSSIPKPKGMSREVYSLLGKDSLAPAVAGTNIPQGLKSKWVNSLKGKWVWAQIKEFSARRFSINIISFAIRLFCLIKILFYQKLS